MNYEALAFLIHAHTERPEPRQASLMWIYGNNFIPFGMKKIDD